MKHLVMLAGDGRKGPARISLLMNPQRLAFINAPFGAWGSAPHSCAVRVQLLAPLLSMGYLASYKILDLAACQSLQRPSHLTFCFGSRAPSFTGRRVEVMESSPSHSLERAPLSCILLSCMLAENGHSSLGLRPHHIFLLDTVFIGSVDEYV